MSWTTEPPEGPAWWRKEEGFEPALYKIPFAVREQSGEWFAVPSPEEIERLRLAISASKITVDNLINERDRLKAENESLREELRKATVSEIYDNERLTEQVERLKAENARLLEIERKWLAHQCHRALPMLDPDEEILKTHADRMKNESAADA